MARAIFFTLLFTLWISSFVAQVRVVKPIVTHPKTTNLAFGLGFSRSVLYLQRNVKPDNDANGLQASLIYGGSGIWRFSNEYTYYFPIDIGPTWYNIKAHSIESNVHAIARFKDSKSYFYPMFGLSYNVFSGYYTGVNDFLHLNTLYQSQSQIKTKWLGVNIGTGYELFFNRSSFFIDYRMRIGRTEGTNELNIMDVCISTGLRYTITVPTIYQLFRGTRSRYSLKTKRTH